MEEKLKTLPLFFMLIAGAVTSIITYILHYEGKTALLILLAVLLLFYVIGFLFQKMLMSFEAEIARKEKEALEDEGKVVAKVAEQFLEKNSENDVKGSGEQ